MIDLMRAMVAALSASLITRSILITDSLRSAAAQPLAAATMLSAVDAKEVPDSRVLVYHYTSMEAGKMMMELGVPVCAEEHPAGDGGFDSQVIIFLKSKGVIFLLILAVF